MKLVHIVFIGIAAVGALYLFHMMTSHKGSQILPGIGLQ